MDSSVQELHEESLVIDGLRPRSITDEKIARVKEGGINVVQQTVTAPGTNFSEAIMDIKETQRAIDKTEGVTQATTLQELEDQDKVSVVFGFQDSTPLERNSDADNVRIFDQLGVRVIQLTYNERNYAGNGCTERVDDGISNFGLDVIESLEEYGIVLDLSHVGPKTALEAMEASNNPVIFSHSNVRSITDHPRNISDELIEAAAGTDGTIGIALFPPMLGGGTLKIDDFVDHIEYVAEMVGPEHVALGMDFVMEDYPQVLIENPEFPNPPFDLPEGIETEEQMPNLTSKLVERGYDESEVKGILGGNLKRVFSSVWT